MDKAVTHFPWNDKMRMEDEETTLLCFHNQQNIIRFPVLELNILSSQNIKLLYIPFHVCHLHHPSRIFRVTECFLLALAGD